LTPTVEKWAVLRAHGLQSRLGRESFSEGKRKKTLVLEGLRIPCACLTTSLRSFYIIRVVFHSDFISNTISFFFYFFSYNRDTISVLWLCVYAYRSWRTQLAHDANVARMKELDCELVDDCLSSHDALRNPLSGRSRSVQSKSYDVMYCATKSHHSEGITGTTGVPGGRGLRSSTTH